MRNMPAAGAVLVGMENTAHAATASVDLRVFGRPSPSHEDLWPPCATTRGRPT